MPAVPKRRGPHSRKGQRRQHDTLTTGSIVLCSHCRRPHRPHHVCPNCGFYDGREVIPDETESAV
jgi:large subunit ribosomal protein L32